LIVKGFGLAVLFAATFVCTIVIVDNGITARAKLELQTASKLEEVSARTTKAVSDMGAVLASAKEKNGEWEKLFLECQKELEEIHTSEWIKRMDKGR
jgi:hypothetical protein